MPLISYFKIFIEPSTSQEIDDALLAIGSGAWKKQNENLRIYLSKDDQVGFERMKKSLPAFTPSALFEGGRKLEYS